MCIPLQIMVEGMNTFPSRPIRLVDLSKEVIERMVPRPMDEVRPVTPARPLPPVLGGRG